MHHNQLKTAANRLSLSYLLNSLVILEKKLSGLNINTNTSLSRAWQKIIVCRRLPKLTHFLVLRKVYSFTNAWQKLLNFPPVAKVIRSPVLGKSNSCSRPFTRVPTPKRRWPFFRVWWKLLAFPRFARVIRFPALSTRWPFIRSLSGSSFSRPYSFCCV